MSTTTSSASDDWIDVLMPASGLDLNALANVSLRDGAEILSLGPIDYALVAACDRLLASTHDNPPLVIQLPRGSNEVGVTLGFALQTLRLRASRYGALGKFFTFTGSIIVVGMDAAVQDRLRQVQVQGVSFTKGLSEALGVSRIRHDGGLVDPLGHTTTFDPGSRNFLYLNARTGWPELAGEHDGCVIIARSSMSSGETLTSALEWTKHIQPRVVIVIDDIGDRDTVYRVKDALGRVTVMPIVQTVTSALTYQLGRGSGSSTLTTNLLATASTYSTEIYPVGAPAEVERAFAEATDAIIYARKINAPMPFAVARATRLLATTTRCISDVAVYNQMAVDDPWAQNMFSLNRRLQRDAGGFEPKWHGFEQGRWAALRGGALDAYKSVSENNPKTHALIDILDSVSRRSSVPRVVVRASGRTAAIATRETLERLAKEVLDRLDLQVLAWSDRVLWDDSDSLTIHPAAPPVPLLPILWSGESREQIVLAYKHELPLLRSQWISGVTDANVNLAECFRILGLGTPPQWNPSLGLPIANTSEAGSAVEIPGADLSKMLELMQEVQDAEQEAERVASSLAPSTGVNNPLEARSLVPIRLRDGRTWWVDQEASVDVLINGRYHQRLVSLLVSGDPVIIPRGDGRDSLFARLVAAHHRGANIVDLDFLLLRFRKACRRLYRDCGDNWAEVGRRLEAHGAAAVHQAKAWAEGTTLAPADPSDVRLVANLAQDKNLADGWLRIAATAELLRTDHQLLGRLVSGALSEVASGSEGPNMTNLANRLGRGVAEVLDEFSVAIIESVGAPASMSASMTGVVR